MRVGFVWDLVDRADFSGVNSGNNSLQCTVAGRFVKVPCTAAGCSYVCDDNDLMLPGTKKYFTCVCMCVCACACLCSCEYVCVRECVFVCACA